MNFLASAIVFGCGCISCASGNSGLDSTAGQKSTSQTKDKADEESQDSSPFQPKCDDFAERRFDDDQAEIRPGLRIADLLTPLSKAIPIRFRASPKNQFTVVPELDSTEGSVHISYVGGGIRYAYWRQRRKPVSSSSGGDPAEVGCMDELFISVNLTLETADGHLDETIPGTLELQLVPGREVNLPTLKGRFIRRLGALDPLSTKFEMTEPEINPKDKFGDTYFDLFMGFNGPRPKGHLVGTREIIVGHTRSKSDDPPVLETIFHMQPLDELNSSCQGATAIGTTESSDIEDQRGTTPTDAR